MIIGRTVTFIREHWIGSKLEKKTEHTGIVLDKITGLEKVEGRNYKADFYLVELEGGIIGKFFCDEAVSVQPIKKIV